MYEAPKPLQVTSPPYSTLALKGLIILNDLACTRRHRRCKWCRRQWRL